MATRGGRSSNATLLVALRWLQAAVSMLLVPLRWLQAAISQQVLQEAMRNGTQKDQLKPKKPRANSYRAMSTRQIHIELQTNLSRNVTGLRQSATQWGRLRGGGVPFTRGSPPPLDNKKNVFNSTSRISTGNAFETSRISTGTVFGTRNISTDAAFGTTTISY